MLNPGFLFWNLAVSLLSRGGIIFIHVITPAKISVRLRCSLSEQSDMLHYSILKLPYQFLQKIKKLDAPDVQFKFGNKKVDVIIIL